VIGDEVEGKMTWAGALGVGGARFVVEVDDLRVLGAAESVGAAHDVARGFEFGWHCCCGACGPGMVRRVMLKPSWAKTAFLLRRCSL